MACNHFSVKQWVGEVRVKQILWMAERTRREHDQSHLAEKQHVKECQDSCMQSRKELTKSKIVSIVW